MKKYFFFIFLICFISANDTVARMALDVNGAQKQATPETKTGKKAMQALVPMAKVQTPAQSRSDLINGAKAAIENQGLNKSNFVRRNRQCKPLEKRHTSQRRYEASKEKEIFKNEVAEIVKNQRTSHEKARAIAEWIACNFDPAMQPIEYNNMAWIRQPSVCCFVEDENQEEQTICRISAEEWKRMPFTDCINNPMHIVATSKNLCLDSADFAALFTAMCQEAGVEVGVVMGFLKNDDAQRAGDKNHALQRHVWNYLIEGKNKIYVDVYLMGSYCADFQYASRANLPELLTYFNFSYDMESGPFYHAE